MAVTPLANFAAALFSGRAVRSWLNEGGLSGILNSTLVAKINEVITALGAESDWHDLAEGTTTDATPLDVWTQALAADGAYQIKIDVLARRTDGTLGVLAATREAVYYRQAGGAPVLLSGTQWIARSDLAQDAGTWLVNITTSGNSAVLRVTGAAGQTIKWRVNVQAFAVTV